MEVKTRAVYVKNNMNNNKILTSVPWHSERLSLFLGVGGMGEGLQILLLDILFQRLITATQNFGQKIKF